MLPGLWSLGNRKQAKAEQSMQASEQARGRRGAPKGLQFDDCLKEIASRVALSLLLGFDDCLRSSPVGSEMLMATLEKL